MKPQPRSQGPLSTLREEERGPWERGWWKPREKNGRANSWGQEALEIYYGLVIIARNHTEAMDFFPATRRRYWISVITYFIYPPSIICWKLNCCAWGYRYRSDPHQAVRDKPTPLKEANFANYFVSRLKWLTKWKWNARPLYSIWNLTL